MRPAPREPAPRRQQIRSNRVLREVSGDAAWPRHSPVARRIRTAYFRKCICAGLEAVGRPAENDSERIPPDAVAEGSAGTEWTAHGGLLLRGHCRTATRLRSTANQITPDPRIWYAESLLVSRRAHRARITSRSMTN